MSTLKVKRVLVSQPTPQAEKSPYFDLAKKWNIEIDFRSFIHVETVDNKEFRKNKINILDHTAVIFNSRTSVDHFFRICKDLRITVPDTMKYFCMSESITYYLQKYVLYRKRKIFYGKQSLEDLIELIVKHSENNKFLFPCSDIHKGEYSDLLEKNNINHTKAIMYKTVASDLSDLSDVNYDMLVFFSPSGIKSLLKNFPKFEQNNTRIAVFGSSTARAVKEAGLRLDVEAPNVKAPSMTMAIDLYLKKVNK